MVRRFNEDFEKFGDLDVFTLRFFSFDMDDNILHLPTKIHMEQKVGDRWLPVDVSTSEFAILRTDTDNYRILENDAVKAFSEFRDTGPRGENAFIEDVKQALKESKFAPAWDAFLKCLSEGAIFSICTARGHEPNTLRRGIELIIDEYLNVTPSMNPGRTLADEMYQNLKKFKFYFDELSIDDSKELTGKPSTNPLVREYLNHCDFFGVSSKSFAEKFGEGSASNPEESKRRALEYSIKKCLSWAELLEKKIKRPVMVKFGMSDDDPKNSAHIMDYFSEASGISKYLSLYFHYTGPETSVGDKNLKPGQKTKFQQPIEEKNILSFGQWRLIETSHQATGVESSVSAHRDNMTQRLYPSTKDSPSDDYHNRLKNQTKAAIDLYKGGKKFAFKRKKNKQI